MRAAVKGFLLHQMRRRAFQPLWDSLSHVARIGQNYWSATPWESGEFKVLATLRPAITFDVGANVGNYAREAARYGKVYAFEPSSRILPPLPSFDERIVPVKLALGAAPGTVKLYGSGDTIASLYDTRNPLRVLGEPEEVEVTTLDLFCREHGIEEIDLLKIDVEGAELQVLQGAREMLPKVRHVQFEFGHPDGRALLRDFMDLMPGRRLYRVVSDGLWPVSYSHELEGCLVINYLASL